MMKRIVTISLGLTLIALLVSYGSAEGRYISTAPLPGHDTSPPQAKGALSLTADAQENELALIYDSGPELYAPEDDVVNAEWSVRFTPPQTCSLAFIELVTYEASGNMSVIVYDDLGGIPGAVIGGPYTIVAPGDLSFQRIDFPAPIDVGENDFHVAVKITQSPTPHPTFDGDGGTLRTSYRRAGEVWQNVENLDLVMRAFVRTYGADLTPPTLLHIPVSVAFAENGAVDVIAKITDQSGVLNAHLYYATNGVDYQSAALTEAGMFYNGTIPAFPAGTQISYYLDAQDNSPDLNTASLPAAGPSEPLTYTVLPGTELYHDDGMPEQFYIESDIYDGNAFAVSFWPSSYPTMVSHVRVLVDDTTSFALTVQADYNGSPGEVLAGPYVVQADSFSGWGDLYIPDADRPTLNYGGFFVVLYWFPETPDLPGVATDVSAPSNRSYWYDNTFGWNRFSGGDWIMRAALQTPTGVVEMLDSDPPRGYRLAQNSPNPFNPTTSIRFSIPNPTPTTLVIHNVLGQIVRELDLGHLDPGEYAVEWDGRDQQGRYANTGVYFYTLRTNVFIQTRKMLLLK